MIGSGGALAPRLHAKTDTEQDTKNQKMPGISVAPGREKRNTRETEGPRLANPLRRSGNWVQAKVGKGVANKQGTMAEAGTQHGAQKQAAEVGRGRGGATSRWTKFRSGRGGGERVRQRGATTKNGY